MTDPSFERQLHERLVAIESGDERAAPLPDLPLRDVIAVAIALVLGIVGLVWWAF